MEVYVDNIVVKCNKVKEHVKDLIKVFVVLRNFGVKLNLDKYVFWVVASKFLGFIVSQRGVKANP